MDNLQKKLALCLVMALIIVVLLPVYWAREPARLDAATVRIKGESIERGSKIFAGACGACHGQKAQGGVGPAIKGADAALTRRFVRNGAGIMPPFGTGQISDRELDDIIVFLNSLATGPGTSTSGQILPPAKPAAPSSPSPSPAAPTTPAAPATTPAAPATPAIPKESDLVRKGEVLYQKTAGGMGCQACHGADASGGLGPALKGTTAQEIRESLKRVSVMSSIKMTDEEIDAVAAYLKSLGSPQ